MTITTDLGEKTITELKNIEGVHAESNVSLADLQQSLQDIITLITGISDPGALQKDVEGKAKKVVGNSDGGDAAQGGAKGKEDQPTSGKLDVKVNDLNGMPQKFTMGALLVNSTLVKMQKTLESMVNKIGKAGNQSAKGLIASNKTVDKSKTQNVEKQTNINFDPKKMGDMTKSLLEFGKACMILSIVPVVAVLKAVSLFHHFIMKMVQASVTLKKGHGNLEAMGKGIKDIVGAIKPFAIGCLILVAALPAIKLATMLALPLLRKFIHGMVLATKDANPQALKEIKNLGTFMVLTGIALALFALDIFLLAMVSPMLLQAIGGLLTFVVFMGLMIVLGIIASVASDAMVMIGVFSILMALSMILFKVALGVLFSIKIDESQVSQFQASIKRLALGFVEIVVPLLIATLGALLLAVFSVLLAVAAVALIIAMTALVIVNKIMNFLDISKEDPTQYDVIVNLKDKIIAPFANKEFIVNALLGALGALGLMLFSIMLAVASIFLLVAVLALLLTGLLIKFVVKDDGSVPAIDGAILIAQISGEHIKDFLLGALALVPGLVYAALLLVFGVLLLAATVAMLAVHKIIENAGVTPDKIYETGEKIKNLGIGIMFGFLGLKYTPGREIGAGDLVKGAINAAKLCALGLEAVLAVAPMVAFMVGLVLIAEAFNKVNKDFKGIDENAVRGLMDVISMILHVMAETGEELKKVGAKTITAIGGLVKDVAEAISLLTDVVLKVQDPEIAKHIPDAVANVELICNSFFGDPNKKPEEQGFTLTKLLATMADKSLKKVNGEAVAALSPLIDSIGKLVDLIQTTATIDENIITQGVTNLKHVTELMDEVANTLINLVTKHKTGFFSSASALSAAQDVIDQDFFGQLTTVFNQMINNQELVKNIKPENYKSLTTFMTDKNLLASGDGAKAFKEIFKNVAKGLDDLKEQGVNNFKNLMDVFNNSDTDKVTRVLNSLGKLAQFATQFKSTADSFEKMAKAIEKMGKSEGKISKMFESLKEGAKASADLEKSTAAATGGTTFDPYVEKIYDIIDDWSQNGVPVRGDEHGNLAPVPADNNVGKGKGRGN